MNPPNGTNGVRPPFWSVTIGSVAHIIILLGACLGFFLSYDHAVNETKSVAAQNTRDIALLAKAVSDLNERGTNFSRSGIGLESALVQTLSERSGQHDRVLAELTPKMERIQTTMEFLRDYVVQQRQAEPLPSKTK